MLSPHHQQLHNQPSLSTIISNSISHLISPSANAAPFSIDSVAINPTGGKPPPSIDTPPPSLMLRTRTNSNTQPFIARLGRDVSDRLYTLDRMVGPLEELLDWDMGLGVDHPDFMDVVIPDEAPDPVNFNVALGIADQVDGLSLGQVAAQGHMANADNGVADAVPLNNVMANGGAQQHNQANQAGVDEAVGDIEEEIQPELDVNGFLFAGDPPIDDID
ncbi:hypothetical protein DCAR_0414735 [Daucus carota subsp. sativus]|uniref:Uncharacterized protein n=1 Tax=Daucus carota subsp. sativus TaxID=79200 RepID=A0A164ZZM5_DAUCS|nr:hypothetical protein DCAR_0414735 [Daucus carota subsp. sativus]